MDWTVVPETPINKHRKPARRKCEIRLAKQREMSSPPFYSELTKNDLQSYLSSKIVASSNA
jgi:hypothetical protein